MAKILAKPDRALIPSTNEQTLVLCHGVFDLVHIGHIRHLKEAKALGDILVVTLTADAWVNKGPNRPAFPDHQRAEFIAALDFVDYVAINDDPTALPVIDGVKPDIYVKGSDYKNIEDDVTGMIAKEMDAVTRNGGRTIFTDDITHSSSELINDFLTEFDERSDPVMQSLRQGDAATQLPDLLDRLSDARILLVGDVIIDDYQYVNPLGKATKDNIIATQYTSHEVFAGGVLAIANNLANFAKQVDVTSSIGDDGYETFARDHVSSNVNLELLVRQGKPTTLKRRFVEDGFMRKLFEVYVMDDNPLDPPLRTRFNDWLAAHAGSYDLVMACDFGHGLISGDSVEILQKHARFLAVNAQTNSGNTGFNLVSKYARADFISLDGPEARLALADKFAPWEDLVDRLVPGLVDSPTAMITLGREGCVIKNETSGISFLPALTSRVIDRVGAGDAVYAITAPLLALGAAPEAAALAGMLSGAMKVGIVGHRESINKTSLKKAITAMLK